MIRTTSAFIASLARSVAAVAVETVLPAGCPVCAAPLHESRGGICGSCWRELDSGTWGSTSMVDGAMPGIETLTTLGPHEGRLRNLIRSFKFAGLAGAGVPLGLLLGARLAPIAGEIDHVVAVPLHWRRRWSRGYNQAEWLARGVAAGIGRPLLRRGLSRARTARPQLGRGRRERLRNVRGAFRASPGPVAGSTILLIDDVVTTGATLGACALALRAAGARRIHAAAAARAERHGINSPDNGREIS